MEKPVYKLEIFEGPMDLLLSLISKHKLSIIDIPIFELVEQYMAYVRQLEEADMEVASEFLETAAGLVYIKTLSLLPVHEEADRLREELSGELIEYRACKQAALNLRETATGFGLFVREAQKIDENEEYSFSHLPQELLYSYLSALGRGRRKLPPPASAFKAIVSGKRVSVASKIIHILRRAVSGKDLSFDSLIEGSASRSDMIATFLALLELIKAKRLRAGGRRGSLCFTLNRTGS